jgi:predicted HAD superfamily phosphohydrolase YqeG
MKLMLAKAEYFHPRPPVAMPTRLLTTAVRPSYRKEPEKVSAGQVARCLTLPFRPRLTETLMRLDKFEALPLEEIKTLVRGLIIDVDGTLIKPGMDRIPYDIVEKIKAIRDIMPVCIFPDDQEHIPELEQLGIQVVRHLPPKTDPRSYDVAVQLYLQPQNRSNRLIYPDQCAMVGDNILTDGFCREIGMKLILVKPIESQSESSIRIFTRSFADGVARLHNLFRQK